MWKVIQRRRVWLVAEAEEYSRSSWIWKRWHDFKTLMPSPVKRWIEKVGWAIHVKRIEIRIKSARRDLKWMSEKSEKTKKKYGE